MWRSLQRSSMTSTLGRCCSSAAAAAASSSPSPSAASSSISQTAEERVAAARTALIDAIMQRDKEIFTLKRQHELSMLRVEQQQNRTLKDQTDRGLYFEQNCNVHTFDTISVGLYGQRNTMYHSLMVQRLRSFKIGMTLSVTAIAWAWLYNKYMRSEEWMYVSEPVHFMGPTTQLVREAKAKIEEENEKKMFVEKHFGAASAAKL